MYSLGFGECLLQNIKPRCVKTGKELEFLSYRPLPNSMSQKLHHSGVIRHSNAQYEKLRPKHRGDPAVTAMVLFEPKKVKSKKAKPNQGIVTSLMSMAASRRDWSYYEEVVICEFALAYQSQAHAIRALLLMRITVPSTNLSEWLILYKNNALKPPPLEALSYNKSGQPRFNLKGGTVVCPGFEDALYVRVLMYRMLGVVLTSKVISIVARAMRDGNSVWAAKLVTKQKLKRKGDDGKDVIAEAGSKMDLGISWVQGFLGRRQTKQLKTTKRKNVNNEATPEGIDMWQRKFIDAVITSHAVVADLGSGTPTAACIIPCLIDNWDETFIPVDNTGEYTLHPRALKQHGVFIRCLGGAKEGFTNNISLVAEQWNKPGHGLLSSSMYIHKGGTFATLENIVKEFGVLGKLDLLADNIAAGGKIFLDGDIKYWHKKKKKAGGVDTTVSEERALPYLRLKVRPNETGRGHMETGGIITIAAKGWMTMPLVRLLHKLVTIPHFNFVRKQLAAKHNNPRYLVGC
jgi:hypothetical protein